MPSRVLSFVPKLLFSPVSHLPLLMQALPRGLHVNCLPPLPDVSLHGNAASRSAFDGVPVGKSEPVFDRVVSSVPGPNA